MAIFLWYFSSMDNYILPFLTIAESSPGFWCSNFDMFCNAKNWYDIPLLIVLGLLLLAVFIWMGLMTALLVVSMFMAIFVLPMIKILYHLQLKFGVEFPLVGKFIIKKYVELPSTRKRLLKESELFMISLNGIYLLKNQSLDEKGMRVLEKTMGLKIASKKDTEYLKAAANTVWEDLSQEEKDAVAVTVAVNGLTSNIWAKQAEEKLRETRGFFRNNY